MSTYTAADLQRIDAAIAKGVTSVELAGRKLQYRSLAEMLQIRAHIAAQIASAAPVAEGSKRKRFTFTTGRGF